MGVEVSASDTQVQIKAKKTKSKDKKQNPPPAAAPPPNKSILIGHNFTPATDVLRPGVWTVGDYGLGRGFDGNFMVTTSPWIWLSYNTSNVQLKWNHKWDDQSDFAVFVEYFNSLSQTPVYLIPEPTPPSVQGGPAPLNRYQWESGEIHFLYSYQWSHRFKTYFNFRYAYFWNDDFPYSLRMDPGATNIPYQTDLTSLTKLNLTDKHYLLFELGAVGLNDLYPYLQTGLSYGYQTSAWLFQLGASFTQQMHESFSASGWQFGRYSTRYLYSTVQGSFYSYQYLQTAVHPELQLQYFF